MMSVCQPYGQVGKLTINLLTSPLAFFLSQEIVCLCENLKTVLRCHLRDRTPDSQTGAEEENPRKDFLENSFVKLIKDTISQKCDEQDTLTH